MKPFRLAVVLALLLTLFAVALFAVPLQAQGDPGTPIDHGLWRVNGTDPALPQDDLEPLRQVIGGAQFVGLGESIHTSGGFYQMKDRTFRFLVERMGFRAFGMETSWFRADRVERYVQTCQGTPRDAIRGIFSVWQSTEVRDMVQWMCEWNTAHPNDRVHFYGFDIQNQALVDGPALVDFLHRLGIGDGDPRIAGIRVCDGVETDYYFAGLPFPPALYQQCQATLTDVAAFFDREEKAIERQTSQEELGWARIHLVGQQAWQEEIFFIDTDIERGGKARDRGMAYVVQAIHELRFPHARTALWAHNGHLAKKVGSTNYEAVEMGTLLADQLKSKYAVIGLVAHETSVDWLNVGACGPQNDFPVGPGSIEYVFHGLGPGAGVLADLKHPRFLEPGAAYTVGAVTMVPEEQFDAILYLDVSPKMHPLSWLPCQ
ncbi:MAG TPA: erythromycin esterase family protein [Thermoanaerobaculia bacterium]|nr:erythromycin esterase family protein [Thermoanaerobaculia bacterium]